MGREISKFLGAGLLLVTLFPGCGSSSAVDPAAKGPKGVPPEKMAGLDFSGLTEAQQLLAASLLNDRNCDCGCGMTLGVCRRDDPSCSQSLALGNRVLALVKEGKTYQQVQTAMEAAAAATRKPTEKKEPPKYVEFQLPVGDAPSVGPEDAKVTILHYLDYQ